MVVDFTATWCGPCARIGPKFAKMAEEFTNVIMVKVDVDAQEKNAEKANINCMPTFQVWRNGAKVEEFSGANEKKLRELCEKYNN